MIQFLEYLSFVIIVIAVVGGILTLMLDDKDRRPKK